MNKPRVLFVGGTRRGFELLRRLVDRQEEVVSAFILQEDEHEPIKLCKQIKQLCEKQGISSNLCRRIEDDQINEILKLNPDVVFVCGWRTIIPKKLYNNIPLGCLAAHDSLLPKYRGFAPTAWAIINGEENVGVSLFRIDDQGIDAGKIFGQKPIKVNKDESTQDIYPQIVAKTIELYEEFLDAAKSNSVSFSKQDESQATYCERRTPADGEICWDQPAVNVFNFMRALTPPYPYSWTYYQGKKIYIQKANFIEGEGKDSGYQSGEVISIQDDGVLVKCGSGQVMICDIMNEFGESQKANHFFSSTCAMLGV